MPRQKNGSAKRSQHKLEEILDPTGEMPLPDADQHLTFPPKLTPGADPAQHLQLIAQRSLPAFMFAPADTPLADCGDYLLYQGFLLKEAGDPVDPVERGLLRDAAFGHLRLGKLTRAAVLAKDRAAADAFSNQALWISVKLRELANSLADYRERARETGTANGDAPVDCAAAKPSPKPEAAVEAARAEPAARTKGRKGSTRKQQAHEGHQGSSKTPARRAANGSRPTKSRKTRAACGGTRTLAPSGPKESSRQKVGRPTGAKVKGPRGK